MVVHLLLLCLTVPRNFKEEYLSATAPENAKCVKVSSICT